MAGIVAVEFGSKMCPTCQAFWPVWADVQKMLSISTSAVVIDGLQGMNIARRDNTLAHGIPSIYVYDGDTVLSEGWSFDAKSLPRFGSDGLVEAKQQQQLLFPMPEVIAEQVCVAVRKNGFACEVTVNGDGVASNPRLRGTGNALELRSSTHMSLSIGLDEVYVIMMIFFVDLRKVKCAFAGSDDRSQKDQQVKSFAFHRFGSEMPYLSVRCMAHKTHQVYHLLP
eukprot:GEMP01095267.1.p1 GENE.GEMP01095267.1~~GEMP01095267.1.p1  ORF type:complete len:225 (+),score=48.07 GEMP01095267.1:130-804(+)